MMRGRIWRNAKQCVCLTMRMLKLTQLVQLHVQQEHPDVPLLDHARELIKQLEALGIHSVPDDEDDGEGAEWEDVGSEGEDGDVDMS